jgi:hypothetical protein
MDAMVHFSASIHDIAKSVNVLDRRLQPALKLRLPYVFGMMSILAPFQSSEARAVQLMISFPARESHRRSWDQPTSSECLIHVETLPSMGTDVFVLVTNLRVSLIRVKKEMSGVLTTTLCMEVYFSEDVTISSKVDDFGHNSVALIIYKRDRDKLTRNDSKRNGTLFALSPPLAWKAVTWRAMPGLTSPDPTTTAGTTYVSDPLDVDDTTAGDEGSLLDKFTVLADYQYRPQLTRLHNAICCVTGDVDSVVPVSWHVGSHAASTDGHTSFGMYVFDKESDTDTVGMAELSSATRFEYLPWIPRQAFDLMRNETAEDQKIFLSKLREECNFNTELEQSQYEGGPDWLVAARARVSLEEKLRLSLFLQGQGNEPKNLRVAESPPAVRPTVAEEDDDDGTENDEMDDSTGAPSVASLRDSLVLYKSALSSVPTPSVRDSLALYQSAVPCPGPWKDADLTKEEEEEEEEEEEVPAMEPPGAEVSNVLTQFRRSQFPSPMAASYTSPAAASVATRRRSQRSSWLETAVVPSDPTEEEESIWIHPPPPPPSDSNDATEAVAPNVAASDVVPSAPDGARPDRLDRLERIVEQLFWFRFEPALWPPATTITRREEEWAHEVDALREEVAALRAQVQQVVGPQMRGPESSPPLDPTCQPFE